MSQAIRHRGPDGEGFMLATNTSTTPFSFQPAFKNKQLNYIPQNSLPENSDEAFLAFAHRRLSIIDLSETGHQPQCDAKQTLWIVFNGEIYNYIELRNELKLLGHSFVSESDTEVVLYAYKQWGENCVKRFNGMWAFCIYDREKKICFASRDRLGVKPFYYLNQPDYFCFASEQKAFVKSGLITAKINKKALHDYLINDLIENEAHNFFDSVLELWPGHNLVYDITNKTISTHTYYHLTDKVNLTNDVLSDEQLIEKIRHSFENSVKLRLRSDVEVGTCLSGGIDSSALAITMAKNSPQPIHCFTSVFRSEQFNEEYFADVVAQQIGAKHYKTEPDLTGFEKEIDALIYSQDVPIWSTSTYAQYKVMELAGKHHIKVVLDGQGADELFAGYHHHFIAKWNNLLLQGNYSEAWKDIRLSAKTIPSPLIFYMKERVKQAYLFYKKDLLIFFKPEFIQQFEVKNASTYFNTVNEQLINDIYTTRLKSFLKCEDRCGMWHGVESRTPFSDDVELMELLFSFNGNKKLKNGVSKYLLREALKDKLPKEVYSRYDKKGFETPMQKWIIALKPKLLNEIKQAQFDFVNYTRIENCNLNNTFHYKLLFKLFVLSRWKKVFNPPH